MRRGPLFRCAGGSSKRKARAAILPPSFTFLQGKKHMKRLFGKVSLVAVGALALAACNAVQGLGEDIKSAGECGEDVIDGRSC